MVHAITYKKQLKYASEGTHRDANLEAMIGGIGASEPEWVKVSKLFFDTIDRHEKSYADFAFGGPPDGSSEVLKKAAERMSLIMVSADVVHLGGMAQDLRQARELTGTTR
ncbi:HpcH/HpaI aldolase/citrate lyase family protein [Colletotrichum tamarilloi]|uniref:HpcH/HpaI aldolase/citrate lyase family protein n=1 Tax=Colletotrichum tamarilloi TaxID=1209934 RepID=A0ABQ9R3T9_9PEZI|nr:HpcH/HpaI aldolase/citrate lyase family protein [Colletotrichum tamarilloi]KAK1493326.1 HpcH/HpaI aldolase/citrate lyase family protein [Colletotrichum tamarilloi]